jgi:hypothetical protein
MWVLLIQVLDLRDILGPFHQYRLLVTAVQKEESFQLQYESRRQRSGKERKQAMHLHRQSSK